MAEFKNYGRDGNQSDLRQADSEKSFGAPAQNPITESVGVKIGDSIGGATKAKKKAGRLPVIVDIITGILLLVVVIGIFVGAYYLFRYYADDYEGVDVEYTFICVSEEAGEINYRTLRNKELYLDTADNTLYFGDVVSAELYDLQNEAGEMMLVVVVEANVKYKSGEGYTVNDCKIAVGSEYTLRSGNVEISGTIVELVPANAKATARNAVGGGN
ncbi:MAG: hypothetical protein IJY39_08925 [Clostridia bacterium]|nr:hypothetical protein [Clostridia bacterium]